MFLALENGVKNIQAAGFNGARTVFKLIDQIYLECLLKNKEKRQKW